MQNFSHAWTTFVQSLPFLSPVDFLSELLPKVGGCVSAYMFFFYFLEGGDVIDPEAALAISESESFLPHPIRMLLALKKKFDTDWCW